MSTSNELTKPVHKIIKEEIAPIKESKKVPEQLNSTTSLPETYPAPIKLAQKS